MKAIITLIFVLFISVAAQAQAQDGKLEATVETVTITLETATEANDTKVARLYRRDNAKVNKALSFTTKRNKAKLA